MSRVESVLSEFNDTTLTVKLLRTLYGTVPMSPPFVPMATIADAVRTLKPDATPMDIERAKDIAERTDEIGDLLWMGNLMDAGDKGIAVFSGLMAAWNLFQGKGSAALETDTQQRNDAVLKALGLAYLAWKAYPGSMADKARALGESPAGRSLLVYYGAVEVALPFADNAVEMGSGGLSKLLQSQGAAQAERLASMASGKDIGGAKEMLTQVTSQLQSAAGQASGYIQPITAAIGPYLPTAATLGNATDKAAGALASAADVMPVYRLLAARLAAESAARRALAPTQA